MASTSNRHAFGFQGSKRCPWGVCRKCGLIALKNNRTRAAIRRRCHGTPDEAKRQ